MFARVTRYHADEDTDQLLEGFKSTIGSLQLVDGFSHGYFMVDPSTSAAVSMTVWDSEEAMTASTESAEERRQQRTETGSASVVSVEGYEVGLIAAAPTVEPAHRRAELLEEHGEETVVA
jgi:heme-degrading monooxygenase HmoA